MAKYIQYNKKGAMKYFADFKNIFKYDPTNIQNICVIM